MKAEKALEKFAKDLKSGTAEEKDKATDTATIACEVFFKAKEIFEEEYPKNYLKDPATDMDIAVILLTAMREKAYILRVMDELQDLMVEQAMKESTVKA
jgi:hypothetical protein